MTLYGYRYYLTHTRVLVDFIEYYGSGPRQLSWTLPQHSRLSILKALFPAHSLFCISIDTGLHYSYSHDSGAWKQHWC